MKWKQIYRKLDQDYILIDFGRMHATLRTNVTPLHTEESLAKIEYFYYVYILFLQENNLTTRTLVKNADDIKTLALRVGDLTDEGNFFNRNMSHFLDITDFNVDPHKRVKRVLVKGLQEMRDLHEKGVLRYDVYGEGDKK